jgi:SSS family solute:Na+ symporter
MNLPLLALLAYVLVQLVIGVIVSRRIRNENDYLLAGRSLGPVLATASIFATWFGAETCVGAAAEVYSGGLRFSVSDPFGYGTCLLVFGLFLVGPLYRRQLTTLADLFRQRYSPGVERLVALLLIPSSLFWASAQIRAFGRVIAWGGTLSPETGVAIAAATACLYTTFGGLLADAYNDLIQGTVLIVCLLLLAVVVVIDTGGVGASFAMLSAARAPSSNEASFLQTLNAWTIPILGSLFAQELLSRAAGSRSARVARGSALTASVVYLLVGSIPLLLGAIARQSITPTDPEAVLSALSLKHLGQLGYLVLTGALVSAILSTVDSALLVAGSFVSHNLAPFLRPAIDDRQRLVVARASVVFFSLLAFLLARGEGSVHGLVSQASSVGSAGVCVSGLMALFTRRGGSTSAYAALLGGVLSWLVSEYIYESEAAFLISLGCALCGYLLPMLVPRLAKIGPA